MTDGEKSEDEIEFDRWSDESYCLAAVNGNGFALQFVHNQTPEICMAAVKRCGGALQYVRDQTPDICLAAVKQIGLALQYVRDKNIFMTLLRLRDSKPQ